MKTLTILLLLTSFSALANYNDVSCSTADQSIIFQGDDHGHTYVFTDVFGNKNTYSKKEVTIKVPDAWVNLSKETVQVDCDTELGIGLFNVLEDYVIVANFTKRDGSGFTEANGKKEIKARMLCQRTKRIQGPCEGK